MSTLQASQEIAAQEGVPADLLLAITWVESGFAPLEADGEHGPPAWGWMGLDDTQVSLGAALTGLSPAAIRDQRTANLHAGAAVLAELRADLAPGADDVVADERWWPVVTAWAGLGEAWLDDEYAIEVFGTLQTGLSAQTALGDPVLVMARDLPGLANVEIHPAPGADATDFAAGTDYPGAARFIASPNRSSRSSGIRRIVVHTTEGCYAGAISWFQNAGSEVSAHYVIRKSDGQITQMVRDSQKAWHAAGGNADTIGIEHEGAAASPSTWTPAMLESSARLSAWLCQRYDIEPDRAHILGHYEIPGSSGKTDPGSYFPWTNYIQMVRCFMGTGSASCGDSGTPGDTSDDPADPPAAPGGPAGGGSPSGPPGSADSGAGSPSPATATIRFLTPHHGDTVGNPLVMQARREGGYQTEFWAGAYRLGTGLLQNPAVAIYTLSVTGNRSLTAKNVSRWGTALAAQTIAVRVRETEPLTPSGNAVHAMSWQFQSTTAAAGVSQVKYWADGWLLHDDDTHLAATSAPGWTLRYTFHAAGGSRVLVGRGYDSAGQLVAEGTATIQVDGVSAIECGIVGTISLGQTVSGSTLGPGSTDVMDGYPGIPGNWSGREVAYTYSGGPVTFAFVDPVPTECDLDIIILSRATGSCVAPDAVDIGYNAVDVGGGSWTVVVDGYNGDACPFQLEARATD